jgi:hypothetical protein
LNPASKYPVLVCTACGSIYPFAASACPACRNSAARLGAASQEQVLTAACRLNVDINSLIMPEAKVRRMLPQPSIWRRVVHAFPAPVLSIMAGLVLLLAANGVLWMLQEPRSERARAQMEVLEPQLNSLKWQIEQRRQWLQSNYVAYSTPGLAAAYNQRVDEHDAMVAQFNSLVRDYNEAARKTSRIYLIPLPRGSGSGGPHMRP